MTLPTLPIDPCHFNLQNPINYLALTKNTKIPPIP